MSAPYLCPNCKDSRCGGCPPVQAPREPAPSPEEMARALFPDESTPLSGLAPAHRAAAEQAIRAERDRAAARVAELEAQVERLTKRCGELYSTALRLEKERGEIWRILGGKTGETYVTAAERVAEEAARLRAELASSRGPALPKASPAEVDEAVRRWTSKP